MIEQLFLDWLRRNANRSQRYGEMHYGWPFKITMIVGTLFFLVLVGVGLNSKVELSLIGFLAVFCALNLAGVLEALCVVVEYDDNFIYTKSPWRANRMIDFNEVVQVKYSHLAQWYVVKTKTSGNIRLPTLLSGKGYFLDVLESRGLSIPTAKFH